MVPWTFWQYVTEDGRWPFREWYNRQDAQVQVAFDVTTRFLRDRDDWTDPPIREFRLFERKHVPLGEMRYRSDVINSRGKTVRKRRIRPLGLLRPLHRDFILFGGAEKQMGGLVYIPDDALEAALRLLADFQRGKGGLYAID